MARQPNPDARAARIDRHPGPRDVRSVIRHPNACIAALLLALLATPAAHAAIDWQNWSPQTFASARQQDKPVFLYLEAV